MLDLLLLSRLQFTLTAIVHYFFVPLTLGLTVIIAYMEYRYWRTNSQLYDKMSRFWTKIFLINFAVGVATGITMEFQFGTNWSAYSRYVGDIFGAPLAAEGVFAFFLESTFVGLLVFGRDKISRGMRFFAALMVAFGTNLSAFWILAANSWQQTPAGFAINESVNRAEMTNFAEVIFNPSSLIRFTHVIEGAYITASFLLITISAYFLLKKRNVDLAKESMKIAIVVGLVFSILQAVSGHTHAQVVGEHQPAKLAAYEAHWETKANAPMLLFAIPDIENEKNSFEIGIPGDPGILSFLAHNSFSEPVTGLKEFPADERPPVLGTFISFRLMVGIGTFMILWTAYLVYLYRKNKLFDNERILKIAMYLLPLPFLANSFGWVVTEWGRQPWAVYGLLTTADGVSQLSAVEVLISLVLFMGIYTFLAYLMVYLMVKEVKKFNVDTDMKTVIPASPEKGVTA